jgi:UDP-galactopyranose mutase
MGRKGRPTKFTLTYAQKQWDNYSPYYPMKESTDKELKEHFNEVHMAKLSKALRYIAQMAGYQVSDVLISHKSEKLLSNV